MTSSTLDTAIPTITEETDPELRQDPAVLMSFGPLLDRFPNHPIHRRGGLLRWKAKAISTFFRDHVSLHELWLAHARGEVPIEELAEFYRDMGYTLGGFLEMFAQPLGIAWPGHPTDAGQ